MKKLCIFILLAFFCTAYSCKPNIQEGLVFTTMNNHKVTTWVNNEPVLVCDNIYDRYNMPFWGGLQKGKNQIHFTAQRLPDEITQILDEYDNPNGGNTTVKIIKGSIFSPKDIKNIVVWTVTEDSQISPRWTVRSKTGWRPSLEPFEDIETIDDSMKIQIEEFLKALQQALDSKDLSAIGYQESDWERGMKEMGPTISLSKNVFGVEQYEANVSPMDELNMIHGKKNNHGL